LVFKKTNLITAPTILNKCGIILLAAGGSTRFGKPKQLLNYKGKSLLQYVAGQATHANADPVIVVLGAGAIALRQEADQPDLHIVENTGWKEGMSSSIRCGINTLFEIDPGCDAVILMVCDQPFVTASLLNELVARQKETGKLIVTSSYGTAIGPPALFHKRIFPELLKLTGDAGARSVVQQHTGEMATVLFPQGAIDIDTAADYESL
jgi:molybdenum cofactor cytidylyltransferase